MHILGIGTASPPARFTQAECLAAFEKSSWFSRLDDRTHFILRWVLQRDNGIEARGWQSTRSTRSSRSTPNTLSRRFLAHAPALATQSAERALAAGRGGSLADRRRGRQHLHRLPVPRACRAMSSSGWGCEPTCRPSTWWARAALRRCPT
jgi:hypothetical protein